MIETDADAVVFNRYKIVHHIAECECNQCGAPLYVGDTFIARADHSPAYCGKSCAASYTGLTIKLANGQPIPAGR